MALASAVRARQQLVRARVSLANQLRAELERFWPGAGTIFADVDSPIGSPSRALPQPGRRPRARRQTPAALPRAAALQRSALRPSELLERLRKAPARLERRARAGGPTHRRAGLVASAAPARRGASNQLDPQIADAVRAHPDGADLPLALPRPQTSLTAAELVAEIGDSRARYPGAAALEADAGMAPSPSSPANIEAPASGGPATTACATPSPPSPTPPAITTPGPATSTAEPAPAAATTRTRSASSAAPGARHLAHAGRTDTPYDPARHGGLNATSDQKVDTGRLTPGAYARLTPSCRFCITIWLYNRLV